MHMALCIVGTALAMTGHFPHRARLWVPHAVGLVVMLMVTFGVGGDPVRWGGITILLLLALGSVRSLLNLRERVEAGVDATAMSVLIAVVPAMHGSGSVMVGHPGMTGMTADGGDAAPHLALVVVTLGAWAVARVVARLRLPDDDGVVASRQVWRANLTGSMAMLAGMTMMIV
jgi:hypothetical protein